MYIRIRISAPSKKEAYTISKMLVEKKLVAGTMIYSGDCHYRRDHEIVQKRYWNIGAFSLSYHQETIIREVKKLHSDTCPIIAFNKIDGNREFLEWIDKSVR